MSLYVMADLHLSSDGSKSMAVFGARWTDYMEKIRKNWNAVVTEEDTVIVPGDISWALKLEDALEDFRFLESLPGKKLIGKGNHDFWWSTLSKMNAFLEQNEMHSIRFLYNNAYALEDFIVCGTRGWFLEESQQNTVGEVDYSRIVDREVIRLRLSLDEAVKLQKEQEALGKSLPILVFLHFPPVWNGFVCQEILDILRAYRVKTCYFGHIHGAYYPPRMTEHEGLELVLTSADFLHFSPMPILPD
ncbi:MAG: metallophosphoesterase [Clostridia bacterium]|nr:metallophosphoesterase [Clostridia bacterium]